MAATTIVDSYSVGLNNSPIKLKVSMSSAMDIGRSTVRINKGDPKDFDDSFEMPLGNADDLIGSKITIDTTETNKDKTKPGTTDFKIEITGGPAPYSNTKSQTVAAGDAVLYTAEITLLP
jgi:hypothetical protein